MAIELITPNWPAPSHIKAFTTCRNVAFNMKDVANRQILKKECKLPSEPIWLEQVHGTAAIEALPENTGGEADASYTTLENSICAVFTADCLPILLCDQQGQFVSAIHAGWRGLANGIIEQTLKQLPASNNLLAWLGPAIGPDAFEVGDEVYAIFTDKNPNAKQAFKPSKNGRWLANLYYLARLRLENHGVNAIYGGEYCTYTDDKRFFSYRRDGNLAGRMASLIWITDSRSKI